MDHYRGFWLATTLCGRRGPDRSAGSRLYRFIDDARGAEERVAKGKRALREKSTGVDC